jgi:argininosuccinate lyase
MPLIASGSLFATLQSIAMSGTAAASTVKVGAVLGGIAGAAHLKDFCAFVDETDPDSNLGMTFSTAHKTVTKAIETKETLEKECASSETCSAMYETAANVAAATVEAAKQTKQKVEDSCASSEACSAWKEAAGKAAETAGKTASLWWNRLREEYNQQQQG